MTAKIATYSAETGLTTERDALPDELSVMTPTAPTVPQEVSLFQARAALILFGQQIGRSNLLAQVDALVAGLPNGAPGMTGVQAMVIREAWANAQVVKRNSPALNMIFPALGLTLPEQLDTLFVIAAGIVA